MVCEQKTIFHSFALPADPLCPFECPPPSSPLFLFWLLAQSSTTSLFSSLYSYWVVSRFFCVIVCVSKIQSFVMKWLVKGSRLTSFSHICHNEMTPVSLLPSFCVSQEQQRQVEDPSREVKKVSDDLFTAVLLL